MSRSLRFSRCEALLSRSKACSWGCRGSPSGSRPRRRSRGWWPCPPRAGRPAGECRAPASATDANAARIAAVSSDSSSNTLGRSAKTLRAPLRGALVDQRDGEHRPHRGARHHDRRPARGHRQCWVMSLSTWAMSSVLASRQGPSPTSFCSSSISRMTSSVAAADRNCVPSSTPMAARSQPSISSTADSTTICCTSSAVLPSRSRCASTANCSCGVSPLRLICASPSRPDRPLACGSVARSVRTRPAGANGSVAGWTAPALAGWSAGGAAGWRRVAAGTTAAGAGRRWRAGRSRRTSGAGRRAGSSSRRRRSASTADRNAQAGTPGGGGGAVTAASARASDVAHLARAPAGTARAPGPGTAGRPAPGRRAPGTGRAAAAQPASCGGIAATGAARTGHALVHDHGAGQVVADPPALRGGERGDQGDRAEGEPDLDHAEQPAHERVPEPLRAAVLADHPQPQRHLARATGRG